ncbi:hypothetical protein [Stenotrophomonas sp.]|uniref:hypothetical protein n=1 Tax=Stenotrophomonas sp. TaxID=69392 RepID=UPI002FC94217
MSAPQLDDAPAVPLAPLQVTDLVEYCLRAAGPCRVRLLGDALEPLVVPLLRAGCHVAGRASEQQVDARDDLAIVWAQDIPLRATALRLDVASLVLVARVDAAAAMGRWLDDALATGWALHPAEFAFAGVPDGLTVVMLARRGVDAALRGDDLRASYHGLAAALVRPGDRVLLTDAAQGGLWRIVQQQSRCGWLGVLADRPAPYELDPGVDWLDMQAAAPADLHVDVLVTRFSHEAGDWPQQLHEAGEALVRSGRLVVLVPLQSGRNALEGPLLAALEHHGLVLDRAWWQSLTRPPGLGQFIEVERDADDRLAIDAERIAMADALVLMAVKTTGAGITQDPGADMPNIVAFQRDYLDASLVRLIVAVGLRLESALHRRQIALHVMQEAPIASADHGAAVCVLLYDPVAVSAVGRDVLVAAAQRYIDAPAVNPTMLRWQVSLAFAAAALLQDNDELARAALLYERVLGFDVLAFSPLLGTKTTAAALRLGWIHFGAGDLVAARRAWARGMNEARRLATSSAWSEVVGDPDAPETFAMPEFAAVMDEAGCLAAALRITAEHPLRPGVAWQWANRSWRSQLADAHLAQGRGQLWQDQLQDAKDWLDGQYHQLTAEVQRQAQAAHALEADKQRLTLEMDGVRAAFGLAHRHAVAERAALQQQLQQVQAEHAQLAAAHARLDSAARNLTVATTMIMGPAPQPRLPAESIAEEMSRLAAALQGLPLKGTVRAILRGLASLLGRR